MIPTSRKRLASRQPEQVLDEVLGSGGDAPVTQWLAVDFELAQPWLDGAPALPLVALYRLEGEGGVQATVVEPGEVFERWWNADDNAFETAVASCPWFTLQQPVPLLPVEIPKPWGREIWYTGVEKRGVARVGDGRASLPLPWLLAVAPQRLTAGRSGALILLKILDPLPTPVFGDLYFELHREKREVYVVTEVDRSAWPDGVGAIRYGFDAELRATYGDDQCFLSDYVAAVRSYRRVREAIDLQLEQCRSQAGVASNAPVDAATLQRWLASLPETLRAEEQGLRAAMDRFTGMKPLRVGDVVKVPCYVPHALQHGVRTVEFQTPVYERLILSFAQKVLTQSHWDTEEAVSLLQIDPPPPEPLERIATGAGWEMARIVSFDDFEVFRLTLAAGARCPLPAGEDYALAMAVGEGMALAGAPVGAGQAVLLPADWSGGELHNGADGERHLLLARPLG